MQNVILPSMGFAILNAVIVQWLKNEGEPVRKEEPIVEVETDKLTYEVMAPIDGVLLQQLYGVGETVEVNKPLATVGQAGEVVAVTAPVTIVPSLPVPAVSAPIACPTSAVQTAQEVSVKKRATPAAKALCREKGLDYHMIPGTGPDGTVTREDVLAYKQVEPTPAASPTTASAISDDTLIERIPFTGMRKTIADNLTCSKNNAVHVTTLVEVDMTNASRLRETLKEHFAHQSGGRLTFVPFFLRAAITGIKEFPILNARLEADEILILGRIDFNIAVDSPKGLLVPLLKNAQAMSFLELARTVNEMTESAKTGALKPEFFGTGTISLSNAGAYGAVSSTPIIVYPQSAVVWTGAILDKPAVVNGEIVPRKLMNLCVSYDHRIMDGAKVARFLGVMKKSLESPELLIVS